MKDDQSSIAAAIESLSPEEILAMENESLLTAYAISAEADANVLSILAAHNDYSVRTAVAENPNTPIEALNHLVEMGSSYKTIIARNPNASALTLTRILASENRGEDAYNNALSNKNTPLEVIMQALLEYIPTSSAIAIKSNERFNKLMSVAKQMDAEASTASADSITSDTDETKRWW